MKKKLSIISIAIIIALAVFGIVRLNETKNHSTNINHSKQVEKSRDEVKKGDDKEGKSDSNSLKGDNEKEIPSSKENNEDINNNLDHQSTYETKESYKKDSEKNREAISDNGNDDRRVNDNEVSNGETDKDKKNKGETEKDNININQTEKEKADENDSQTHDTDEDSKEKSDENSDSKNEETKEDKKEDITLDKAITEAIIHMKSKESLEDWDIIALRMAGNDINSSEFIRNKKSYKDIKIKELNEEIQNYTLTDYARTILTVLALEENPYNFNGKNLVEQTKEMVEEKGELINGHIWGIIALEACGADYDREAALNYLESEQKEDGGFVLLAGIPKSDKKPDITAMAVYSMIMTGKDKNYPPVKKALEYLKTSIKYLEEKPESQAVESLSQIVIAVTAAKDDLTDYQVNGKNILDEILTYRVENGGFKHIKEGKSNDMATQQTLIALMFNKEKQNLFEGLKSDLDLNNLIIDKPKTVYGAKDINKPIAIKGNLDINADDVTIKNVNIDGILNINPGKNGNAFIENVRASQINVLSGGEQSIHFNNVNTNYLSINTSEKTRIENKGKSKIGNTIISSDAVLDNISGEFGEIKISSDDNKEKVVELRGRFEKPILVTSTAVIKTSSKAEISKIIISTENNDKVTLDGKFNEVEVAKKAVVNITKNCQISKINNKAGAEVNIDKEASVKEIINNKNKKTAGEEEPKVTISIIGYKRNVLNSYSVDLNDGDRVLDILERALGENGISYSIRGGNYVVMIDNQKEKDLAPLSGWRYSINGVFSENGVGEQEVNNGDRIRFIYVKKPSDTTPVDQGNVTPNPNPNPGDDISIDKAINESIVYLKNKESFDDWDIIALKMAGCDLKSNEFYKHGKSFISFKHEDIRENIENYSQNTYAKSILSVLACEYDPNNIGEINLIDKTKELINQKSQLINDHIWSIIALEAVKADYDREKAVKYLEEFQNEDGSFSLVYGTPDNSGTLDITAMAVDALIMSGKDKNDQVVSKALKYLKSSLKNLENNFKKQNVEGLAQTLIAAIIAEDDLNEYVINGKKLTEEIFTYWDSEGGFKHSKTGVRNQISTQQTLMALMFYKNNDNMFNTIGDKIGTKVLDTDGETYGSQDSSKPLTIEGNVNVVANNVKLENIDCSGEIILDPGKDGNAYLTNVKANRIKVLSGGINSIHFDNVDAAELNINAEEKVRIENKNKTSVSNTYINSSTVLDNIDGDFGDIEITAANSNTKTVELKGTFNKPVVVNSNAVLKALKGTKIKNVTAAKSTENINIVINGDFENIEFVKKASVEIETGSHVDNIKTSANIEVNLEEGALLDRLYTNGNEVELTGDTDGVEIIKDKDGDHNTEKDTFKLMVCKNMKGYLSSSLQSEIMVEKEIEIEEGKSALYYLKENAEVNMSGALIISINGVERVLKHGLSPDQKNRNIFGVDWFVYQNGSKTDVSADSVMPKKDDVITFDYHEWDWTEYLGSESLNINVDPKEINKEESVTIRVSILGEPLNDAVVYVNGFEKGRTNSSGIAVISFENPGNYTVYAQKDSIITEKVSIVVNNNEDPNHGKNSLTVNTDYINRRIIVENKEMTEDIVALILYHKTGEIAYVNHAALVDGKHEFSIELPEGEYHGYVKGETTDKVQIEPFVIKAEEEDENKVVSDNMTVTIEDGCIKVENEKVLEDNISLILYDEFDSIVYMAHAKLENGQYIFTIQLYKGIYHGLIRGESTKKIEIKEFIIN